MNNSTVFLPLINLGLEPILTQISVPSRGLDNYFVEKLSSISHEKLKISLKSAIMGIDLCFYTWRGIMAGLNVLTTAVNLREQGIVFGRGVALIQNLGPGKVYLNTHPEDLPTDGFEIAVGGVYESPGSAGSIADLWLLSDTEANVRIITLDSALSPHEEPSV